MLPQVLLFTTLLFSSALSYERSCNHEDQSSLLAFSANVSISTSSYSHPLNWSFSISCCHWEGVDCDTDGRVTHLQLPSRGLEGIINTSSIGNLGKLTHLNLSNNNLHGTLLGEGIVGLTNLMVIDLSSNSIHGSIPREIGELFSLEKLHLNNNNLHGPIPSSLMNCSKLEEIILRVNQLNGDISKLDLSRLIHLQKLDLGYNKLDGTIPESIYSCKSLLAFRVASNNIIGQISPRIVGLKSLSFLSLSENYLANFTTTLRLLAKCKNLTVLLLSANFYGESLPVHRTFIGLNDFSKLQLFAVANNGFGGPIPDWLSNLKSLRYLDLSGNEMTGKVPDWLGTLPNLIFLSLSDNNLSGEVPLQLFLLPSLISQKASLTYFHCDLPVQMNREREVTWTSHGLYFIAMLMLSNNRFSGKIPLEIGNLQGLQGIDFSSNNFSGHIPVSISNLKYLEFVDLSGNSLTGEIPTPLQSLNFLSHFNVSCNKLEGPIPVGGQFETFDESNFMGNPHLCGEQINRSCRNNVIDRYVKHDRKMHDFVNGLIVGCSFGFSSFLAIVASYFWFTYSFKGSRRPARCFVLLMS